MGFYTWVRFYLFSGPWGGSATHLSRSASPGGSRSSLETWLKVSISLLSAPHLCARLPGLIGHRSPVHPLAAASGRLRRGPLGLFYHAAHSSERSDFQQGRGSGWRRGDVSSAQAAMSKRHTGLPNTQTCFHGSGGRTSNMKVPSDLASAENPLAGWQMAAAWLCPHTARTRGVWSLPRLVRAPILSRGPHPQDFN